MFSGAWFGTALISIVHPTDDLPLRAVWHLTLWVIIGPISPATANSPFCTSP
jgi:hypothetical protein